MSTLGAIGSAALSGGTSLAGAFLQNYFNKKQLSNAISKQKSYDKWYMTNIYPEYQEMDFSMAKRYAQNSASWEVEGLKQAGLNPLLAVSNGMGSGVSYSSPETGGNIPSAPSSQAPNTKIDLPEAIRDWSSADLADAQAKVAKDTASSIVSSAKQDVALKEANVGIAKATKAKIDAESRQIEANTARTLYEAQKLEESKGLKNSWAHDAAVIFSKASKNPVARAVLSAAEGPVSLHRYLKSGVNGKLFDHHSDNSAKTPNHQRPLLIHSR